MKTNLFAFLHIVLTSASFVLYSQVELKPIDDKGCVKFQIKNLGLTIEGYFEGVEGKILWEESDLANSFFDVSIKSSSINTGIALRDKHLRKEDYFDAIRFPLIRFKSTKITSTKDPNIFEVRGKLTIKESTEAISFLFTHSQENGNQTFKGKFSINRRDFAVGNKSLTLADNVIIFLNVSAAKSNVSP